MTHTMTTSTSKMSKITRAIVLTDIHVPYQDKASLAAVEKFMADYKFDYYINLGDLMDFNCISDYNHGHPRLVENERIFDDYKEGNKVLDRHQEILRRKNKDCKFILLEGNHDFRAERYIDEFPQMEGMIEVEKCLRLKERGIKWVRSYKNGDVFKLGNATFHHGLYTPDQHAKKMVEAFGCNIFYGHLHDVQSYSKTRYGADSTLVGQSLGCLCEYNQKYIAGKPTRWQQAFTVFEFQENGNFNYHVVRITNHQFVYNGKLYRA